MGTQSDWILSDLQTPKSVKSAHKLPLVSPRMDVDVTGVSMKNMRTHLIDHPRDDGLKHREQLWNFQQKHRGAVGKSRQTPINVTNDDIKCESSSSDDINDEDCRQSEASRSREQSSLASRFRKRLIKQKVNLTGLRTSDCLVESSRRRSVSTKEPKEDEKSTGNPGIQRLYSSGLIVKNTLYQQIRNSLGEDKQSEQTGDNSRILETIQKYGSLEKLPDITGPKVPHPHMRFLKSLNSYNRRILEQVDKRLTPLRRTYTHLGNLDSSKRKLIIVSRRGGPDDEKLVRLGCIDPYNDVMDDDLDFDDTNNGDGGDLQDDEDDECDNENQISEADKLHARDCDKKRPEHIDIRCNVTQVNTQDDMVLIEKHKHETEESHKTELRHEFTFHGDSKKPTCCREETVAEVKPKEISNSKTESVKKVRESWNPKSSRDKSQEREDCKERTNSKRVRKKTADIKEDADESDSDISLDIPEDRFGHTTHTIDKKLAIRKPWEWKPSPYRWIDKPYIKESDKPYIERIINKGEVIDEFNYDSFARTKPLKVQNYPEGAGYKDRQGNLR